MMPKLSESVNAANFTSTVAMLESKINDLIYINPDEEHPDFTFNKNFDLLAHRLDDFSEESWFSKASFDKATEEADTLGDVLEDARDALIAAEQPKSDEEAKRVIETFEDTVRNAMDKHMPTIQATFSTGNEIYSIVRPYLLPLLEKINHLYVELTGGLFFDVMMRTPTNEIQHNIQDKYKLFSESLDAEAPESDEAITHDSNSTKHGG
jgi:hypothetical protein